MMLRRARSFTSRTRRHAIECSRGRARCLVQMIVEHGGEQVVRGGDGVEVAGEVEVDASPSGIDLAVAAAGRAALDAEDRAHRRLAHARAARLADVHRALGQADRRRRLAFARRRRRDGGDEDIFGGRSVGEVFDCVETHLADISSIWLPQVFPEAPWPR